jgi:hypothetical protein
MHGHVISLWNEILIQTAFDIWSWNIIFSWCGFDDYDDDNDNNNSIQFIYLCAWQQPDMANYSQAQKQRYRLSLKKQTKKINVQYETYRV